MIPLPALTWLLRGAGASLIALGLFHGVLFRAFGWSRELSRLSPLTARVFLVHTFFIVFVLMSLGLLTLVRPELLVVRSDLARVLLYGIVVFWAARLVVQPTVFDPVLALGKPWRRALIVVAHLAWVIYLAIFAAALAHQLTDGTV